MNENTLTEMSDFLAVPDTQQRSKVWISTQIAGSGDINTDFLMSLAIREVVADHAYEIVGLLSSLERKDDSNVQPLTRVMGRYNSLNRAKAVRRNMALATVSGKSGLYIMPLE